MSTESTGHELVLELSGVSRQFGAVRALTSVSFDCRAGEVHALVGENGSGKSTLLGIASGFVDPDRGTVRIGGRPLPRDSPALSRKLGLAMAYQDGSSIQAEPVKNNLYCAAGEGRPPYRHRKKWARRVLADFDLDLELFPDAPVGALTLAERQLFEVAKALVTEPKVLLLDEPTTALGPEEVEALHRTVLACKRRGVGVVYVSHRLPEVLEIADRITVLRDGRHQGTFDAATTTEPELVERIVGRPFDAAFPPSAPSSVEAADVLVVDALQGQTFGPVSFTLRTRRGRGDRRRRGQRPAPALRLLGRADPSAGRPGGLRGQGAVLDLDPRGGGRRDHAAPWRSQARGVDGRPRRAGQRHRAVAAALQPDRVAAPTGRARRGGTARRAARDPHPVARSAGRVPVRRQPAEGVRRPVVPQAAVGDPGLRTHPRCRRGLPDRHLQRPPCPCRRRCRPAGQVERPHRALGSL